MRPPIITIDREGWLSVFASVGEAEAWLEAPDVEDDEYLAFDADGAVLDLTVERQVQVPWHRRLRHQDPVRVSGSKRPPDPGALTAMLFEAVSSAEPNAVRSVDREPLSGLVAEAQRYAARGFNLRARGAQRPIV
ncbi:MAG TPA: hypothetical protein VNS09_07805 [Solirubrobacter sp.]|nr:hypothetical protein [Solirubrobacter sp.]